MKKIVSFALPLVLVCVLVVTTYAASIGVKLSSSNVDAGSELVVTIALDQPVDVSEGATMIQGALAYDGTVLEFQKVELGADFSNFTAAKHTTEDKVLFHYLSMDNSAVEFSEGTIAVVYFTAREDISEDHVRSTIVFSSVLQNAQGEDVGELSYTSEISVLVSKEHSWDDGVVTAEATCYAAGVKTYSCTYEGCDAVQTLPYGEALGHSYVNGICTRCGEEDPNLVARGYCGDNLTWVLTNDGVLTFFGEGAMRNYFSAGTTSWNAYIDRITTVVLPEGVTSIGNFAFYGMTNLESISLPAGLTSIGEYAFKNCPALDGVEMPDTLKKIGQSAFFGCCRLGAIEIPEGIYTIWSYTFKNCTSLTSVSLPSTLIKIDEAGFYGCSSLTELTIPDSIAIIGKYCFKNCTGLTGMVLPTKLTEVRESAFYGCSALTEVVIPDSVTKLNPYAFKNCTNLPTVSLPQKLTTIAGSAFYGCTGLKEVVIPADVSTVDEYAFSRCSGLSEVTFRGNAPYIGTGAFNSVIATVSTPVGWDEAVKQNYGGTLTWVEAE